MQRTDCERSKPCAPGCLLDYHWDTVPRCSLVAHHCSLATNTSKQRNVPAVNGTQWCHPHHQVLSSHLPSGLSACLPSYLPATINRMPANARPACQPVRLHICGRERPPVHPRWTLLPPERGGERRGGGGWRTWGSEETEVKLYARRTRTCRVTGWQKLSSH